MNDVLSSVNKRAMMLDTAMAEQPCQKCECMVREHLIHEGFLPI